jgi:hypothetical protein
MVHNRRQVMNVRPVAVALGVAFALLAVLALAVPGTKAQEPEPAPPPKPPVPAVPPVPTVPTVPELPSLPDVPEVPDVPRDPGQLTDLVTPLSSRMMLSARPRRAQRLPATVRFDGFLMAPMRLNRVDGFFERTFGIDLGVCRGPVTVGFKSGGRTIARRRASVTNTCTFRSSITIRKRKALGRRGRLRATARFGGNKLLGPAQHSTVVRVG